MANPYGPPLTDVDAADRADGRTVDPSLVTLTHVIYALHALSILIGIVGSAMIIGAFLFSIPSIVAVILNYVKRSEVRGSYLDSHFRWQIRTFWFAALWAVIGFVLIFVLVGFAILALTGLWLCYRVARGWLALRAGQAMPT